MTQPKASVDKVSPQLSKFLLQLEMAKQAAKPDASSQLPPWVRLLASKASGLLPDVRSTEPSIFMQHANMQPDMFRDSQMAESNPTDLHVRTKVAQAHGLPAK